MSSLPTRTPLQPSSSAVNRPSRTPHPAAVLAKSSRTVESKDKRLDAKQSSSREIDQLQRALDDARARVKRRDDQIAEIKAAGAHTVNKDRAEQLEDLVQRHQASKAEYESEIMALQAKNAELQRSMAASDAKAKAAHGAADLRKALSSAEGEVVTLRREVQLLREASDMEVRARIDERTRWTEQLEVEQQDKERLEELLGASTDTYQRLHHSTVSRAQYQETRESLDDMIARDLWNRERVHDLKLRLMALGDERDVLRARLVEEREAREDAERTVDGLLRERRLDDELLLARQFERERLDSPAPTADDVDTIDRQLVNLTVAHAHLSHSHMSTQLDDLGSEHNDLLAEHALAQTALLTAETALTSLRRSHAQLQAAHEQLVELHAPCGEVIVSLKGDVEQLRKVQGDLSKMVDERDRELKLAEDRSKKLQQGVKRSEEKVVRRLIGEQALEDEISSLRDALEKAAPFEDMYNALLAAHHTMLAREEMALDEADRLGAQNAELIGTVSAVQRVGYIEGVRREMALVKHELATTRILLNRANETVADLQGEVQAYKSIDGTVMGGAGGGRTKVVRRQPEGSGLIGGAGRRSVSANVRR